VGAACWVPVGGGRGGGGGVRGGPQVGGDWGRHTAGGAGGVRATWLVGVVPAVGGGRG